MKHSKGDLLAMVLAAGAARDNPDKCAGAKSAVRAACKNVKVPVDHPDFPDDCNRALDMLSECMEKYY